MAEPVRVKFKHDVGAEAARKRANETVQALFGIYAIQLSKSSVVWNANHAEVEVGALGLLFRGTIDIDDERATLTVPISSAMEHWRREIKEFLSSKAATLGLPQE
jgi:hypothetical protein